MLILHGIFLVVEDWGFGSGGIMQLAVILIGSLNLSSNSTGFVNPKVRT